MSIELFFYINRSKPKKNISILIHSLILKTIIPQYKQFKFLNQSSTTSQTWKFSQNFKTSRKISQKYPDTTIIHSNHILKRLLRRFNEFFLIQHFQCPRLIICSQDRLHFVDCLWFSQRQSSRWIWYGKLTGSFLGILHNWRPIKSLTRLFRKPFFKCVWCMFFQYTR